VVVLEKIVVDRLRHVEAPEIVASRGRLLAHDAASVGRVVAANIKEIADIVSAAAVEDLLAIGLVRLVTGRAKGSRRRARHCLELCLVDGGQVEQPVRAWLHKPAHAVARAENALDLA
jgi:hypothetical protein